MGEDYWLKFANSEENNQFLPNQVLPPTYFFTSGSTNFRMNDSFWNNCAMNPQDSGDPTLRFAPSAKKKHSNLRRIFIVPCNYEHGHGVFSFLFYVSNIKNCLLVDFDSFLSISIYDGKIKEGLFTYEENTWNNLTVYIDFGDAKTSSTYDIEFNGERKTGEEISYNTLSSFKISIIESTADTYIAELRAETDYKIPNYFRNVFNDNAEKFGSPKYEELFGIENKNENKDNSNNILYIFIIVVGILILIIGIAFCISLKLRKARRDEDNKIEPSNIN